ncbi:hypothetical protein PanWU01x14_314060, partial [Parasponia andersonii]
MEPRPRDFTTPTFRPFEGKTEPLDHIYHFQQKMALETRDEAVTCKVFSTTLAGPALLWFRLGPSRRLVRLKPAAGINASGPPPSKLTIQHGGCPGQVGRGVQ